MKNILLFILIFCSISAYSQEKKSSLGRLLIIVSESDVIIKIDSGKIIKQNTILTLDTGLHKINFSGIKVIPLDTTFRIYKDSLTRLKQRMKYNEDYKNYRAGIIKYSSILSTSIALTALSYYFADRFYNKAKDNKSNYEIAQSQFDINKFKSDYKINRTRFNQFQTLKYIAIGGTIGSIASIYIIKKKYGKKHGKTFISSLDLNLNSLNSFSLAYTF